MQDPDYCGNTLHVTVVSECLRARNRGEGEEEGDGYSEKARCSERGSGH